MTVNAISTIPAPMPLQDMQTLAVAIAKSNLFGIKTPEQALVLMAIAQAEGRHPVEAARDYDIINGRPAKKAEAMLRDFILAGGKVAWHALTDELADATFTHPQTGEVRIDWDMKRAKTAFGQKDMYAKFPRQMLRSRVVSEGVRTLWPLATSGMYEPGEAADIPAHNGPTIDAERPTDARQAMNDAIPLRSAAAATPRAPRKADPMVYGPLRADEIAVGVSEGDVEKYADIYEKHNIAIELLDEPNGNKWVGNLEMLLANATSQAVVVVIAGHQSVGTAVAKAPEHVKRRVNELLAQAYGRFAEPEAATPSDDLDEVVIKGEEKMGAGN
jgi:hypothetical protein